jgi:hypothetical protein
VDIRVTLRAFLADVGKHQFDVAFRALHLFMHAPQRIVGLVVIELRNAAYGLPTQRRMTVLARNVQSGAVRVPRDLPLPRRARGLRASSRRKEKKDTG